MMLLSSALAFGACDKDVGTLNTDGGDGTDDPTATGCTGADTFVGNNGKLALDREQLVNQCGEPVRLKGISSMWLHDEFNGFAESRDAMEFMIKNWNLRVIRAAMSINPTWGSGAYLTSPENMKTKVRTIVQNAIDFGVYVVIDWHSHDAHTQEAEAIDFFTEMAGEYGEYPNVIYEPYNEPLDVSWASTIKPYHEAVVAAIRAVDPDNIIVMGTPTWSQGVDVGSTDPVEGTNLMYTLHFYACSHGREYRDRVWQAYTDRVPIFVTEWGATDSSGGTNGVVCEDDADDWFESLDNMNASWIAWKLDGCADSSCILNGDAQRDGPWEELHGHGPYVISKMLESD